MRKILWAILGVGVVCFVLRVSTYVMPEFVCVLLALVLFVGQAVFSFVLLWHGITRWRKTSRLWFVPGLLCFVFVLCSYFGSSPLGRRISDWRFGRHLGEYSKVVDGFRGGTIACQTTCDAELDPVESTKTPADIGPPVGVGNVWGERCDDGGYAVLFRLDTDVPLLHEGYIFKGYGEKSNCNTGSETPEKRWEIRHVMGQWYHFSDKPGL